MPALAALAVARAQELALLTALAVAIGEPLAQIVQVDRIAGKMHGATKALRRKLNRGKRSIATRTYRGITALIMLEVSAVFFGVMLADPLPSWQIFCALVVTALLGRGFQSWSLVRCWRQAKAGKLLLEKEHRMFGDTHGVLRHTVAASAERFAVRVTGAGFWYIVGGSGLMFAYLALAMAATHYSARREEDRAFGWAATELFAFADALPRLITAIALLLAGLFVPGARPFAALRSIFSAHRSWHGLIAALLDISLGGKMQDEAGSHEIPWHGKGSAQLTVAHLTRWLALLLVATLLWLLTLLSPSIL